MGAGGQVMFRTPFQGLTDPGAGVKAQAIGLGFAGPPPWGLRQHPLCPAEGMGNDQQPARGR